MSWGPCYFYYRCPACGRQFKADAALIPVLGPRFELCPDCGATGTYVSDGPIRPDDADYAEIPE